MSIVTEVQQENQAQLDAQIEKMRADFEAQAQARVQEQVNQKLAQKRQDLADQTARLEALKSEIDADQAEVNAVFAPAETAPAETVQG
jgi:hypothetical protein